MPAGLEQAQQARASHEQMLMDSVRANLSRQLFPSLEEQKVLNVPRICGNCEHVCDPTSRLKKKPSPQCGTGLHHSQASKEKRLELSIFKIASCC